MSTREMASENEVKIIIRGILTSSPNVLTVGKIQRDFEELIGYKLPFKQFKCNSTEQYLRKIPDICQVKGTGMSAQVLPIITEKSAHINEMVTKQKNNSKNKGFTAPKRYSTGGYKQSRTNRSEKNRQVQRSEFSRKNNFRKNFANKNHSDQQIRDSTSNQQTEKLFRSRVRKVPLRVQSNLNLLMKGFSQGIWCCDLPFYYLDMFKEELTFTKFGYNNLIDMCIELPDIFHYVRPGRDDFRLYDKTQPLPDNLPTTHSIDSWNSDETNDKDQKCYSTNESVDEDEKLAALPELEWSDFNSIIPRDIFKIGTEIPRQFLPIDTEVGCEMDVVVVEVYDPSKFWVYLGASNDKTPLDVLMDEIQLIYMDSTVQREYSIPIALIQEGLYCIKMVFGEFHRARIIQVLLESKEVKIFCIDYGTVCKVPMNGLFFLKSKFTTLPAQAIRCRLSNIGPILRDHAWPRSSADAFHHMVNRRDTKVKISHIDWDHEIMHVFLADVTDCNKIFYVNERLVKNGDAVWEDETEPVPLLISNFQCKVSKLYLYPTFRELELGLTPDAAEINKLENMNTPIELCIPQYFQRIGDEQISPDEFDDDVWWKRENTIEYRNRDDENSLVLSSVAPCSVSEYKSSQIQQISSNDFDDDIWSKQEDTIDCHNKDDENPLILPTSLASYSMIKSTSLPIQHLSFKDTDDVVWGKQENAIKHRSTADKFPFEMVKSIGPYSVLKSTNTSDDFWDKQEDSVENHNKYKIPFEVLRSIGPGSAPKSTSTDNDIWDKKGDILGYHNKYNKIPFEALRSIGPCSVPKSASSDDDIWDNQEDTVEYHKK